MKSYLVFIDGVEVPDLVIKAKDHNAAEKKAQKKYANFSPATRVTVEYTEI